MLRTFYVGSLKGFEIVAASTMGFENGKFWPLTCPRANATFNLLCQRGQLKLKLKIIFKMSHVHATLSSKKK